MKTMTIVGNRPQFIKASALWRVMGQTGTVEDVVVHTGQHYDPKMSDIFFKELELPRPDYHLSFGGLTQGAMTGRMIEKIEAILMEEKPDCVIVFGDTNSTLAGALAATKLHIPVAHIESGLRSFNRKMPEEINRIVADHCADLLFTPTESASLQLQREGVSQDKVHLVGDVMYDAFLFYKEKTAQVSNILDQLKILPQEYVLATVHRAENTDEPGRFEEIMEGLSLVSEKKKVIFPIHPRTRALLNKVKIASKKEMALIDPVGYFDMLHLASNAQAIFTDSGGLQKEAYYCKVPCITLREETEWTELVEHRFNRLAPPERNTIVTSYLDSLAQKPDWSVNLYGDGKSSQRILEKIIINSTRSC